MRNLVPIGILLATILVTLHAYGATTGHAGLDAGLGGLLDGAASLWEGAKSLALQLAVL